MEDLHNFKERLRKFLNSRKPKRIEDPQGDYTHSSVLLPFFIKDNQYWLLLIRRADTLQYHSGEVSFPGGMVEEEDLDLVATAKRETFEEVGVLEEDIEILGSLDDVSTLTSNFIIHPFIGVIPFPYSFTINSQEVSHLIKIPLQFFLNSPNLQYVSINYKGETFKTPAFDYEGAIIWGATERIIESLISLIKTIA